MSAGADPEKEMRTFVMWKEGKDFCQDNRGTTMVTVIISFALLLICVVSYYGVQRTVENMMMSAKDLSVNNSALIKAYYLEETEDTEVFSKEELHFSGEDGSFTIHTTLKKAQKEGLNGSIYYFEKE